MWVINVEDVVIRHHVGQCLFKITDAIQENDYILYFDVIGRAKDNDGELLEYLPIFKFRKSCINRRIIDSTYLQKLFGCAEVTNRDDIHVCLLSHSLNGTRRPKGQNRGSGWGVT